MEGNTQTDGVHMDAVADDSRKQPLVLQRGSHQSRLSGGQLRHGIEQMGHAGQATVDCLLKLCCGCVAVTGGDTQPGADGVIMHGPVSFAGDEGATRTFARTTAGTRWQRSAA